MRLLEPLTPDPRAPLARVHPLAKIASAFVLMLAMFLTVDPVTPALVLVAIVGSVPATGVPVMALARRSLPVLLAASGIAFFNTLVTRDVATGVAVGIRLAGIALAGIVAVASVDPTELADGLVEHLHAPRRFVVGALAAFRLTPLFADEWETIAMARRARGIAGEGAAARVGGFPEMTRSLLVAAIRRATRLAVAMDGRGFAESGCRTLARPRPFEPADWALVAASVAVAIAASLVSFGVGSWHFFLS